MTEFRFNDPSLSPAERVQDLLDRLTLEEKIGLLSTHNQPVERLHIGEWFVGQEIARGLVNREAENPTTVFPQPIGMAASFDPEMMLEIGRTAAREARAYYNEKKIGGLMVWGPTVDLSRDPRWGRTEECYGEDPFLTGEMTVQYTSGLRDGGLSSENTNVWATIPTLKHFCANNHEEHRAADNANLSPRLKHEFYYAAFRAPIMRGGAHSVMTAYNDICHAPAVMNHDLKNVLKKEWGLGFVVTDGADFSQNVTAHKVFSSHAEALQACLYAGADTMTDELSCVSAAAHKALAEGLISEADLDRAVGNLLESRVLLGHFDPETPFDRLTRADVNTETDKALNLRAAREGMVLLENNGALPLHPEKIRKIGLFGQNADCNLLDWYTGTSSYQVSIRNALEARGFEVVYDLGWDIIVLQAPNGKYIRVGADDCLYADTDKEHADQFYRCCHDDDGKWENLRHVKSGRFVCITENTPKLGGTEVYGWFTSETLRVDWNAVRERHVISDYLHGRQFCLNENGKVICRPKARPDDAVCFYLELLSYGAVRICTLAEENHVDAVIYCGGNDPEQVARECYDRKTIDLPSVQADAVVTFCLRLQDKHIPVILTLVSSYPYALFPMQELASPDAILWTSHAGPELGNAVAETLFGLNNPAGRLPVTWYTCDDDLPDIKDYDIVQNKMTYRYFDSPVLYPFGHGLSYSCFEYADMQTELLPGGIHITAKITNTSDRDGDEVVQVYAHAESKRIIRPDKQLCAFARLHIGAGETVLFDRVVPFRELEIYDVSRERFCLEQGDYTLLLSASSLDVRIRQTLHIPGEIIPPRDLTRETRAELFDSQHNTEIFTNPLTGVTHIRGLRWDNSLTFQNCDFSGVQSLTIWAAAPVQPQRITVFADGEKIAEIPVPSCDGFEDFRKLTVPVQADGCHDLRLCFGEGICIRSLKMQK